MKIQACAAIIFLLVTTHCKEKDKKPEAKDEEPLFGLVDSDELEYNKAVDTAQSKIAVFADRLNHKAAKATASVKVFVPNGDMRGVYLWLIRPVFKLDTCEAEVFEVPAEFNNIKVGTRLKFLKKDIQDWFILDEEGRMLGGYTLRYMRRKLKGKAQQEFDEYMGVKTYL